MRTRCSTKRLDHLSPTGLAQRLQILTAIQAQVSDPGDPPAGPTQQQADLAIDEAIVETMAAFYSLPRDQRPADLPTVIVRKDPDHE